MRPYRNKTTPFTGFFFLHTPWLDGAVMMSECVVSQRVFHSVTTYSTGWTTTRCPLFDSTVKERKGGGQSWTGTPRLLVPSHIF